MAGTGDRSLRVIVVIIMGGRRCPDFSAGNPSSSSSSCLAASPGGPSAGAQRGAADRPRPPPSHARSDLRPRRARGAAQAVSCARVPGSSLANCPFSSSRVPPLNVCAWASSVAFRAPQVGTWSANRRIFAAWSTSTVSRRRKVCYVAWRLRPRDSSVFVATSV